MSMWASQGQRIKKASQDAFFMQLPLLTTWVLNNSEKRSSLCGQIFPKVTANYSWQLIYLRKRFLHKSNAFKGWMELKQHQLRFNHAKKRRILHCTQTLII